MALDAAEVAEEAGSAVIGRPHFAAVLVKKGHVDSIEEAFERYLKKGAPAYVERAESDAGEIFEGTRSAGGVAALAHPLSLGLSLHDLERRLAQWREQGLVGVECFYSRYDARERRELAALTRARGLVPTGGSDFHGSYKPGLFVGRGSGDLDVPDELLAELVARRPAAV
jgi:predicted metal-dependent phosphoesterase TrpH